MEMVTRDGLVICGIQRGLEEKVGMSAYVGIYEDDFPVLSDEVSQLGRQLL